MSEKEKLILDILLSAIQREIEAYDYYYKSSQSSPYTETGSLFMQLAREEKKHKDILVREYQTVKRLLKKENTKGTYLEKDSVSYLIPDEVPFRRSESIPEIELSCISLPTEFLGGDYFETLIIKDPEKDIKHLAFLLYDIMGHGLDISPLKARVREALEYLLDLWSKDRLILSPGMTLTRLGKEIWQDCQHSSNFMELFFALYNPVERKITYSSAGHPPPLLLSGQGTEVRALTDTDLVMGIVKDKEYRDNYIKADSGDVFILYSDGVTEAFNPAGEMYEEKRLIQTVQENFHQNANQIARQVCKSLKDFTRDKPLTDELTLVIAKIK
ncbi:MAG: SpoIIE family protein phosphatase [candidate division Zixibacteria bacterium]|nr:SpoIIE family protein phosphatase [candidate division Zixibacteria bacterium]